MSALSYAYGIGSPIENEVVVLATGLDQYLQELFHHLDYDCKESVTLENFQTLLEILGLKKSRQEITSRSSEEEGDGKMDFKEFHRKLVQCFIEENDQDGSLKDKQWKCDDEFVEAEVQVMPREGHTVRTVCTECFRKKPVSEIFHSVLCKQGKCSDNSSKEGCDNVVDGPAAGSDISTSSQVTQLQEENEGLRELVEDMRQALQSSDAKNLALEVAFRKLQSGTLATITAKPNASSQSTTTPRPQYLSILYRELNRLQDTRNTQVEEAIRYTQELEVDLWRSKKDQETLAKAKLALIQNQKSLTDQLERARHVLDTGLHRVKMLENQASKVEELQTRLEEMEGILAEEER